MLIGTFSKKALFFFIISSMTFPFVLHAEEFNIHGDVGVYSQYISRGNPQGGTQQGVVVQGSFATPLTQGLSTMLWFSTLGDGSNVTEFDYSLDLQG